MIHFFLHNEDQVLIHFLFHPPSSFPQILCSSLGPKMLGRDCYIVAVWTCFIKEFFGILCPSFHQSENQVVNHFSFSPFNSLSLPSSCVHSYMVPLSSQLCVSVIHFSSENDFSLFFFPTENRKFKAFRWLMALDFD